MHALKKRKHYLSKVPAYTDNVALRYWKNAQNLSPREVRWPGYLDLDIAHIPGVTRCYQHGRGRPFALGVHRPLLPCDGIHRRQKTRTSLTNALVQNISMPLVTS